MSKMRLKERARREIALVRAILSADGLRPEVSMQVKRCISEIEDAVFRGDSVGVKRAVNELSVLFLKNPSGR